MTLLDANALFINTSSNADSYVWNFGDGSGTSTVFSPTHSFPSEEPGNYTVTLVATNAAGCVDTAIAIVIVEEDLIFYVPNTFTPDGDEYNETFKPVFTSGFDPYDYGLYIFNRWGELIFESHNTLYGWAGNYGAGQPVVQDGSYTWKIEFKTTKSDERKLVIGHVNVLR
jgi:gliding motility-associated-like protein